MSLEVNTQGKIFRRVIITVMLVIGIFFFVLPDPKPAVYGIIFGSSINLLNFRLMSLTLEKSTKMKQSQIIPYIMGNYMVRYLIYGIVLVISAVADYINLYTVVLGFFMVKFTIISDTFYDIIVRKQKNNSEK